MFCKLLLYLNSKIKWTSTDLILACMQGKIIGKRYESEVHVYINHWVAFAKSADDRVIYIFFPENRFWCYINCHLWTQKKYLLWHSIQLVSFPFIQNVNYSLLSYTIFWEFSIFQFTFIHYFLGIVNITVYFHTLFSENCQYFSLLSYTIFWELSIFQFTFIHYFLGRNNKFWNFICW